MLPKPTKADRLSKRQKEKELLAEYRVKQRTLAIYRDGGYCVICWFKYNRRTVFTQVHHTYGRGRTIDDYREHFEYLMCVCDNCHPQPIKSVAGNNLEYVEQIRVQSNRNPIREQIESFLRL